MVKTRQFIVASLAFALVLPLSTLAVGSPPAIPLLVYGDVTVYGTSASVGAVVSVWKDGVEIASTTLVTAGKYSIQIPASYSGSTLVYKINGTSVTEKVAVNPITTASDKINLTIASASSGGGSSGSTPPTLTTIPPAVTTLTTEQKVYDANNDNKIDVLDFNALIVHWGEKGTDVMSDFDGNGVVDVFDFNALMVHWTA